MITQVKFVGVPVSDAARALAFYTDKLGFAVATDQPIVHAVVQDGARQGLPRVAGGAGEVPFGEDRLQGEQVLVVARGPPDEQVFAGATFQKSPF